MYNCLTVKVYMQKLADVNQYSLIPKSYKSMQRICNRPTFVVELYVFEQIKLGYNYKFMVWNDMIFAQLESQKLKKNRSDVSTLLIF